MEHPTHPLKKWYFDRAGVKDITPGDDVHQKLVTASKISAAFIPSRSPYESYYSLWLKMHGDITATPPDESVLERGHMLEPFMAAWFAARHPEFNIRDPKSKVWFYDRTKGFGATPDRYLEQGGYVVGLLEIKTALTAEGWGEPGTDQIPEYYYDQVQWQMLCTGVPVTHVVRLSSYLSYEEYTVKADAGHQAMLLAAAEALQASLAAEEYPNISDEAHMSTYEAVRAFHPEIDGSEVELPVELVRGYYETKAAVKTAEVAERAAKTLLLDAMGTAKTGTINGEKYVTRQARGTGTPYPQAVRGKTAANLPEPTNTSTSTVRNDLRRAA